MMKMVVRLKDLAGRNCPNVKSKFETYIQFVRILSHKSSIYGKSNFQILLSRFRFNLHPLGDIADSFAACTLGMDLDKWGPTHSVYQIMSDECKSDDNHDTIIELESDVTIPIGSAIRVVGDRVLDTGVTYNGNDSFDAHNPNMKFYFVKRFGENSNSRQNTEQYEYERDTRGPIRPINGNRSDGTLSIQLPTYLWNTFEYNEYNSTGTVIRGHDTGDDAHTTGSIFIFIRRNFDIDEVNLARRDRELTRYRERANPFDEKLRPPLKD